MQRAGLDGPPAVFLHCAALMLRIRVLILIVAAGLALTACGDDDEPSGAGQGGESAPGSATQSNGAAETASGDDQPAPGDGGGQEAEPTDDDAAPTAKPAPGSIEASDVTGIKLGSSLQVVEERLGGRSIRTEPGPGGTTCHVFRVKPAKGDTTKAGKQLRAQLCFKGGKLRGAALVNESQKAPSSG